MRKQGWLAQEVSGSHRALGPEAAVQWPSPGWVTVAATVRYCYPSDGVGCAPLSERVSGAPMKTAIEGQ